MLLNPDHERAKKVLDIMSPVDHINAILKLLPKHYQQENALSALCNSFFDQGKQLTDEELHFYANGHIQGMQTAARQVLNLGVTEAQRGRYKVIALLFRLGQAEEILEMLSKFNFGVIHWKRYNVAQLPTAGKFWDIKTILYQVMYAFRIAFPKRPDAVKFIMARRTQLLKDNNI